MLTTTLNAIRACGPCESGWKKLLNHLGKTKADDEPLPFETILDSNGLEDALWCCRSAPQYDKEWRLFAVWCARQVEHLMTDERSKIAINVAERYAHGEATEDELAVSWEAAWEAAWAASREAAWEAAWAASRVAAWVAAWDAADALRAAAKAADALRIAADAARAAQADHFRAVVRGEV